VTAGQLIFPHGVRCTVYGRPVRWDVAAAISRVTRDAQAAFTAAYARAVATAYAHIRTKAILDAEKAVVALHFGGSRAAYAAALRRAHTNVGTARGVIADELRRAQIQKRLHVAAPGAAQIQSYYDTYASAPVRLVQVNRPAPWLGNAKRGFALGSLAPPQIFALKDGAKQRLRTMTGTFTIKVLGPTVSLAEIPLAKAARPIAVVLTSLARSAAYERWLLYREKSALDVTLCWRDQMPALEVVPLTDYLPYLSLDSGASGSSGALGRVRR
jgi:hypothetical protein